MFRLTAILAFILLSQLAYANSEADSGRFEVNENGEAYWLPSWLSRGLLYEFKNHLIEVKAQKQIQTANPEQCTSAYEKLYKKSEIRWSIFFGYGDGEGTRSYTTDFAERDLIETEIKSPCPQFNPEIQFCGFRQAGSPGEYVKQIQTKNNSMINIRLRLYNASLTSEIAKDDEGKKRQRRKSKSLEKAYIEALKTDDVVFYSGHARHGAGPGFRPLVKKSKDWWITTLFRPMANDVLYALNPNRNNNDDFPALEKTVKNPAVIGMFSCEAEAHFGYDFANNSDSGLILTRQSVDYADNIRLLYASSNALLTESCEEDFNADMKEAITKIYYRKGKNPPQSYDKKMPKIFNFFHKDRVKYKNDLVLYFQNKGENEMDITLQQP